MPLKDTSKQQQAPIKQTDWLAYYRQNRIGFHVLYWGLLFPLAYSRFLTTFSSAAADNTAVLFFTVFSLVVMMLIFYSLKHLSKKLFYARKYLLAIITFLLPIPFLGVLHFVILKIAGMYFYQNNIEIMPFIDKYTGRGLWIFFGNPPMWMAMFTYYAFFLLPGFMLVFAKELLSIYVDYTRLEKEKIKFELDFLKAQINPHFLFNTLNNLFSLSLQKSDLMPDVVLRLSDIMRYTVYETSEPVVDLDKEITFIKNYIDLERIRHDDICKINFTVKGNATDKKIPPLILISFVENAFKHGINSSMSETWVNINLEISKEILIFEVENSKKEINAPKKEKGGIGLVNTKKRLQMFYPDKHQLSIENQPEVFKIKLILNIS